MCLLIRPLLLIRLEEPGSHYVTGVLTVTGEGTQRKLVWIWSDEAWLPLCAQRQEPTGISERLHLFRSPTLLLLSELMDLGFIDETLSEQSRSCSDKQPMGLVQQQEP